MNVLSRRSPPKPSAPTLDPVGAAQPATLYVIVRLDCRACWVALPALLQLANWCAGNDLPLQVLAAHPGTALAASACGRSAEPSALLRKAYPASRWLVSARLLLHLHNRAERDTLAFMNHVLQRVYIDGHDPRQTGFYHATCEALALDAAAFDQLSQAPLSHTTLQQDTDLSLRLGATGTPCVIWQQGQQHKTLASGLLDYELIRLRLRQLLDSASRPGSELACLANRPALHPFHPPRQ